MIPIQRWGTAALAATLAAGAAGCGTPGAPLPPSLNLPRPASDLAAARTGNQVTLTWTTPKKTTDKQFIKGSITVRVCRREDDTRLCEDAGETLLLAPGAVGSFSEPLPSTLTSGSPRILHYFVELKNHNGRSAGLSNQATVLAGAPPGPVQSLHAEIRKEGVVLTWTPDGENVPVRLLRRLLTPGPTKSKESLLTPPPEPAEQNLLIDDASQGRALDQSIHFGETVEYRAQRVARATVEGKTLELDGALSPPLRVDLLDVFPPAVPIGLAAVATAGENGAAPAIDLSWQPDTETDLAGYILYRREENQSWQQISPSSPILAPAFHDADVQSGHTYHYTVSAVDKSGHESGRSSEAEETVPSQ